MSALSVSPRSGIAGALSVLDQALDAPRESGVSLGNWRWVVRQRMAGVRDALASEAEQPVDAWLAARGGSILRERNALAHRFALLGHDVLESAEVERIHGELKRLVSDTRRYAQRLHDLAYDSVELELGGSE
jgi:hypothetical protein